LTPSLQQRLSRLAIAAFCEPGPGTAEIIRHLQRSRATVHNSWPLREGMAADADLVICDYAAGLARRLPWPPGEAEAALLVVLPASAQYDLAELQGICADAVLHRPASAQSIDTAVMLALDHASYLKRLKARIARMEENLRAVRSIERAKQLLMSLHKIDDAKAFQMLRDLAMQKRVTVASLADGLVDSADLLTYK
jgi:AmiR/NasT family two-component response regulator